MSVEKCKRYLITMQPKIWDKFKSDCEKDYKTASGVIRELIIRWGNDKEIRKRETRK